MTQISAGVICYTPGCLSTRLPSLRYIRAHTHTCTLLQLGNAISFWCAIRNLLLSGQWGHNFFFSSSFRLPYFCIVSYFNFTRWSFFFSRSIASDTSDVWPRLYIFFVLRKIILQLFYITHYDFEIIKNRNDTNYAPNLKYGRVFLTRFFRNNFQIQFIPL